MNLRRALGIVVVVVFILLLIGGSIWLLRRFGHLTGDPTALRQAIAGYGAWAYVVYTLAYIVQILFAPMPGQVLNIAAGMLFGPAQGILVTWISNAIGGFLAMSISRYMGRRVLEWFLEDKFVKFGDYATKHGMPLLIFLALFPTPIGDGLFYLAGLTTVPLRWLTLIITVCRLPGFAIYVLAGDQILKAGVTGWILGGIGAVAVVLLYLLFGKRFETAFEGWTAHWQS